MFPVVKTESANKPVYVSNKYYSTLILSHLQVVIVQTLSNDAIKARLCINMFKKELVLCLNPESQIILTSYR